MVKKLVLFDKIYSITEKEMEKKKKVVFAAYLNYLKEKIKGFSNTVIDIKKLRTFDKRFEISIEGPEEHFVFNLLRKEIGAIKEFKDVEQGQIFKGTMVDIGKFGFGIFVDCAILNPKTDVLINLHSLREQLCQGKKLSIKEIIKSYDFIDNFPVSVKITKVDKEKNKLKGEFANDFLNLYKKILSENLEAVFVSGATNSQFKKALNKSDHLRDVNSIKRYGYLEHLAILKESSDAPGIIANIGKYLKHCKLSAIRPARIIKLYG